MGPLNNCGFSHWLPTRVSRVSGLAGLLIRICSTVLVLAVLAGLPGCSVVGVVPAVSVAGDGTEPGQDIPADENGRYSYLEQSNTEVHQAGTIESVIEYGEDAVMGVHYPVFGKEEIDDVTEAFVDDIISRFRSEVADFEAEHAELRAELNVDYETWLVGTRLVSIKFIILVIIPGYVHPDVSVETFVYDLDTGEPVFLEDILVEDGLPRLVQLAREALAGDPDYAVYVDYVDSDLFSVGTEPDRERYRSFLLTQEHLVLMLPGLGSVPGAAGTPSVEIPWEHMEGIVDFEKYGWAVLGHGEQAPDAKDVPNSQAPQEVPIGFHDPEGEPHPASHWKYGPVDPGEPETDGQTARRIDPDKPMVALTFDDGPFASTTGSILDTLKEYDAAATFFVLGNRVHDNAELLRRMVDEGHEIGNHSYSHKRLEALSVEELREQIEKTQAAVKEVTGVEPLIMRPTYGRYNDLLKQNAGLPIIMWSVDPRDWETRDAEAIVGHILSRVQDGDIILMHDIYASTAEAVKRLVPELIDRGFQLVTVTELLTAKGLGLAAGKIYRTGTSLEF